MGGLLKTPEVERERARTVVHHAYWKPLLRQAGLPDTRFHELGHTCTAFASVEDVDLKIASEMLGHSASLSPLTPTAT
jgi:integrase